MPGDRQLRRKRCRGNLRPASFHLTPDVVEAVLSLADRARPRVLHVPMLPVKLVDRPRRSEDPRLARANDIDESTPARVNAVDEARDREPAPAAEVTSEGAGGGRPDLANAGEAQAGPVFTRDRPSNSEQQIRLPMHPLPHLAGEPLPQSEPSERPSVEVQFHKGERPPIDIIRAAAVKLCAHAEIAPARPALGERSEKRPVALPPLPFEARRRQLEAAIRFLGSQGVLVTVRDRLAPIRTCAITGKRDPRLAEGVIEYACERGFTP